MTDKPRHAGAPEDEIEITAAMIEAGVAEIAAYNLDYESMEEAVARIFEAMLRARKGQ